jgi:hypothetical protein
MFGKIVPFFEAFLREMVCESTACVAIANFLRPID